VAILTIAIATTMARAARLDAGSLPPDPRWRYVLFCQGGTPEIVPVRPDVKVVALEGTGAAASRNAAIAVCETDLLLFSDDDVRLLPAGLAGLIDAFAARPQTSLLAGQTLLESGASEKTYPPSQRPLSLFNAAKVGTVELAVRPERIRQAGIRFDERFGAGAEFPLGDEYIFISDCLRLGLQAVYVPIPIAVHEGGSSGLDFRSAALARARARVLERVFGRLLSPPIKLGFMWRHRRRFLTLNEAFGFAREFLPWHG
jgi:hypothetical protein